MTSTGRCIAVIALIVGSPIVEADEAESLALERSRVLAVLGGSKTEKIELKARLPGPGRVFFQPNIGRSGALAVRVRLSVVANDDSESWTLKLFDDDGDLVWELVPCQVTESVIWSPEIEGSHITAELFSTTKNNPVHLRIDRLAYMRPPVAPQAIVGPTVDIKPIAGFSAEVKELGKAVAQIKFVADDGNIYNCSGYLVTQQLLLTNQHCISSESERQSAIIVFDFDHKTTNTVLNELSELVRSNYDLDYSLVRLSEPMSRQPLVLSDESLAQGMPLYVVQHPNGEPKRVSRNDCSLDDVSVAGRGHGTTDFSHRCDTLGGSSGAPVVSLASHKVIGLHHLGFDEDSVMRLNRAVHFKQILADIPITLLEEDQ